jgi:hypothetical protein
MNFNIYEVLVARLAKEVRPRAINTVIKRLPDLVKQQMHEKATQQAFEEIYQRRIQQTARDEFAPQVEGAVDKALQPAIALRLEETLQPAISSRLDETLRPAIFSALDEVLRDNIVTVVDETLRPAIQSTLDQMLRPAVFSVLDEILRDKILAIVDETFRSKMDGQYLTRDNLYLANSIVANTGEGEYLVPSNPVARDFFHPEFQAFCEERLREPALGVMHRKTWEFAYIFHRLNRAGVLRPGARGLGFGVGSEQMPAIFASMGAEITATDAPMDIAGWKETGQYSGSKDNLFFPKIIKRKIFDKMVHFEGCDMNNISPDLKDFDFCWSSCALEHLGSIQHGLDFILNSVENTLKIGGYACHTTELNMSSDDDTLETEGCVLFRKKDLVGLCKKLEERGHWVEPLRIEPGDLPPDYLVDVPPYASNPHLKLLLASYVTTSVGLIVRRGR